MGGPSMSISGVMKYYLWGHSKLFLTLCLWVSIIPPEYTHGNIVYLLSICNSTLNQVIAFLLVISSHSYSLLTFHPISPLKAAAVLPHCPNLFFPWCTILSSIKVFQNDNNLSVILYLNHLFL